MDNWAIMSSGLKCGYEGAIEEFVQRCKDHYWDSLSKDKDMILLHIEAIAKMIKQEGSEQ